MMNDELEGILDEMDEFITRAINVVTTSRTIEMLTGMTIDQVAEGFRDGKFDTKQELPVIPQYVAEWIEQARKFHSISWLLNYRNIVDYSHELTLWCFESGNDDNLHKLARAWLDGYEVEEQKYYVINNENYFLLAKDKTHGFVFSTGGNSRLGGLKNSSVKFELTEQEIKDYDERYWAFAEPVE